jgi:hypothetical protein
VVKVVKMVEMVKMGGRRALEKVTTEHNGLAHIWLRWGRCFGATDPPVAPISTIP